jgi:hypothetical protein
MKRSSHSSTTKVERSARVVAVVARANARGEKVPQGVGLIGFAPLSKRAHAHAGTLVSAAQRALSGRAAA